MIETAGTGDDGRRALEPALQSFWADYAGLSAARVRMVRGDRILAVWLEEVLTPAELKLAATREGRAQLRRWGQCITDQALPQLEQIVQARLGRPIKLAEAHLDISSHTLHLFFEFAEGT